MKHFFLGFLTTALGLPLLALILLIMGFFETRADALPPEWEARLMTAAVHASVERSTSGIENPQNVTDETLIAGGKLYLRGCAGCHGTPGKTRHSDPSLYPQPPQLPTTGTAFSPSQAEWVIRHGIRRTAMSAYPFYSDEQFRSLAAFVTHINHLSPAVAEGIQQKNP
jgi:mono/diheme cytochrome c family protein